MPKLDQIQVGGSSKSKHVQVLGVKDLIDSLTFYEQQLRGTALRRGLYAAARIMRDEARRRVSVRTGALKRSIDASTRVGRKGLDGRPVYVIGLVKISKKAFAMSKSGKAKLAKREEGQERAYKTGQIYPRNYAHLVEFGTAPHNVSKKKEGNKFHPGAQPKPFMRPAFDTKIEEAREKLREELTKAADAAVARRAKKRAGK